MTATRDREAREVIASVRSLHARLHAAVLQFDSDPSSPLGVPNMAGPIRLLACSGRGNQLLQRLSSRLNISIPTITVSAKPNTGIETSLSVGSLPMLPPEKAAAAEEISLPAFLERECLVVDAERDRVVITWDNLLRSISEKRGYLHSDSKVPRYFDELDTVSLSDLKLIDFMFRHAGAAISACAHSVLTSAGENLLPGILPYEMPNRITSYWFGLNGIFAATPTQQDFERRLQTASKERLAGKNESAAQELRLILSECRTAQTLFYRRLCAAAILELGYTEFASGHSAAADLLLSRVASSYRNSMDPKLKEFADKALGFLYGR